MKSPAKPRLAVAWKPEPKAAADVHPEELSVRIGSSGCQFPMVSLKPQGEPCSREHIAFPCSGLFVSPLSAVPGLSLSEMETGAMKVQMQKKTKGTTGNLPRLAPRQHDILSS